MFWPDPTHQPTQPPTHPPNHTPIHGWGILHRFQIFKRNWNILISSSVIEFLLILGVHPLGGWQMGAWGWGWVWGCGGVPCTHTHTHTCTHMHVKHANHAKHGCLHVGSHLQFLYMYTCVYVREPIEIIQFCLKICDPWTLLHTYRLGLMCRWGVSYPKWHFYVLDSKKYIFFTPVSLW